MGHSVEMSIRQHGGYVKTYTVDVTRSNGELVESGIMVTQRDSEFFIALGECMGSGEHQFVGFSRSKPPVVKDNTIFDAHPYRDCGRPEVQRLRRPCGDKCHDERVLVLLTHFDECRDSRGCELNLVGEGTYMLLVLSNGQELILTAPDGSRDQYKLSYVNPSQGLNCLPVTFSSQPEEALEPMTS